MLSIKNLQVIKETYKEKMHYIYIKRIQKIIYGFKKCQKYLQSNQIILILKKKKNMVKIVIKKKYQRNSFS